MSTVGCDVATVNVYDCMNSHLSTPLKKIVADLIHTSNKFITINYVKMQYQTGTSDCGLFAIAAACSICHGQDPGQLKYKQEAMRAYLLEAFDDMTHLEPFPSASYLRTQTTRIESKEVPVYCSCRLPNDGSGMVQCSTCKEWYHLRCMGISLAPEERWDCKLCS